MQQGHVTLQTLFVALSMLLVACPVAIPAGGQIGFACETTADCGERQVCIDNLCQPPSTSGLQDAAPVDAARTDTRLADAPRADTAGTDLAGTDATGRDVRPADVVRSDSAGADEVRPDATLPDAVRPDATRPDTTTADAAAPDTGGADACLTAASPAWWDTSYAVRFPLDVAAAPAGYTIEVALSGADASAVFDASMPSGRDLRLVRHGTGALEIDRDLVAFSASNVILRFRIQETGGGYPGGSGTYFLYTGNAAAPAALADRRQVYLLFEDFEGFSAGDSGAPQYSGLPEASWRMVDDGGNMVYRAARDTRTTLEFVGQDRLDAAIEARVRYQLFSGSTDWVALQYRGSNFDPSNYVTYAAGIHRSNGAAQIRCWSTTDCSSPVDGTALSPSQGTWYQIAVRFVGASSTLRVDGVQQAVAGNTWTGGMLIGLTVNNASAYFDDVKVRMAQDPEPPVQLRAVEHRCE